MVKDICKWLVFSLVSLCCAIAQLFGIRLFYTMRKLTIIQKRYPVLAQVEAIIAFISLLIVYPVTSVPSSILAIPRWITQLTQYAAIQSIIGIETGRIWLMSYDLHCLRYSQDQQWKSIIDVSLARKNWYFENKSRFANQINVTIVVIGYVVLITAVDSLLCTQFAVRSSDNMVISIEISMTNFIAPIFTAFIYFRIRNYGSLNDSFFFFFELKMLAIIGTLSLVLAIVGSLVDQPILSEIMISIAALMAMTLSLFSTLYIPLKIKERMEARSGNVAEGDMDEAFKSGERFDLFMAFMIRELNNENALSFVELVQFKRHIVRLQESESQTGTAAAETTADRPAVKYVDLYCDELPISSIVSRQRFGMNETENCRDMAHELYLKYIQKSSTFEVNIGFVMRGEYEQLDNEHWAMSMDELLVVFDKLMFETNRFMFQSYCRFKQEQ